MIHTRLPRTISLLACGMILLVGLPFNPAAAQDEPALPPGLGGPEPDDAPALPPGLGGGDAPGLPPGLGGPETGDAPALPPGLGDAPEDSAAPEAGSGDTRLIDRLPPWLHGFWETRAGMRTHNDPGQPGDLSIGETRLQLEGKKFWDAASLEVTADFVGDAVDEEGHFDLRQLRLSFSPLDTVDVRIGRQVLTWGTGDMLFINDLFPKDWPSYFLGRDQEYLKAPSDAIRVGWYPGPVNVEVVYTPRFDRDRFIRGGRVTYYNPLFGPSGRDSQVQSSPPNDWFQDDEIALRIYRRVDRFELALYAYDGFWKSPGGQSFIPFEATHPRLRVYGASARGPLGKGIFNVEAGYYDSRDDRSGADFAVNNSEFRFLIGYEQELAKEFTGAVQYYLEHMMDYDAYANSPFFLFLPKRDEDRHVFTARLTKLLMNQNLTLSFFAYYSPSDNDAYLRPRATYKVNDHWTVEAGGNVFLGQDDHTFFGQFETTTNAYASMRFSF